MAGSDQTPPPRWCLLPALTNLENILLPLQFGGKPGIGTKQAMELLEQIGLANRANSYPAHLSGGQQRRIAIARAFINQPDIILADEPTGDLDENTEREIFALFRDFNDAGTTFVVVTHNREFAKSQRNPRTLQMTNGLVLETDPSDREKNNA